MIVLNGLNRSELQSAETGGSKSESNRALMIGAYSQKSCEIVNLSKSADTILLKSLLDEIGERNSNETVTVDCKDSGAVCRFLLTYLSTYEGRFILTGSNRLCDRPISPLVDALRGLGASIDYVSEDGKLPLFVEGGGLKGGEAVIDARKSSQFATSLLLAAPMFENGLILDVISDGNSARYISMTVEMMRCAGASVECKDNIISVAPKPYGNAVFEIESDWSGASYLYEAAALDNTLSIGIKNLKTNSLQGDSKMAEIMLGLGVVTAEEKGGIRITKRAETNPCSVIDVAGTPDLFPALCATFAGLGLKMRFEGVENLKFKESSRVEAMRAELAKIGVRLEVESDTATVLHRSDRLPFFAENNPVVFSAHNDHRIAMALSILTLKIGAVCIDDERTVAKSFPDFWRYFNVIR